MLRSTSAVLAILLVAGCASTGTEWVGERYGVKFTARETAGMLKIECEPPAAAVPAQWVGECDRLASRHLMQMVAEGRLSDFPEPPFGMAGDAARELWEAAEPGRTQMTGTAISREIDLED